MIQKMTPPKDRILITIFSYLLRGLCIHWWISHLHVCSELLNPVFELTVSSLFTWLHCNNHFPSQHNISFLFNVHAVMLNFSCIFLCFLLCTFCCLLLHFGIWVVYLLHFRVRLYALSFVLLLLWVLVLAAWSLFLLPLFFYIFCFLSSFPLNLLLLSMLKFISELSLT